MRQALVDTDRSVLLDLHDLLVAEFPELAPGTVLAVIMRVRRDLSRLGSCEGFWEAVEIASRHRLVELAAVRGLPALH